MFLVSDFFLYVSYQILWPYEPRGRLKSQELEPCRYVFGDNVSIIAYSIRVLIEVISS
jgi:hypothetical protein